MKILVINPGSTSTKLAVFKNEELIFKKNIAHADKDLQDFTDIFDQLDYRLQIIRAVLEEEKMSLDSISAIAARGGLLPPVKPGAYLVTSDMIDFLKHSPQAVHASNLAAALADALGSPFAIKSYVYDPVTIDEMLPVYKLTGLASFRRRALAHNLNMREMVRRYAADEKKNIKDLTLIVAHLGGGITLTLHQHGRIIDLINDEEGSFSPERTGALPCSQLIDLAFSGKYSQKELQQIIKSKGGLMSHLGTRDARIVEERITAGDKKAKLVYEAMALSVAKNIAALSVDVKGQVDAIILTGGLAFSKLLTKMIIDHISFIAPVTIYAGEDELKALASGVLRVLEGKEVAKILSKEDFS